MHRCGRRLGATLCVIGVILGSIGTGAAHADAAQWKVLAGATGGKNYEYTRYYPNDLLVHQGDVVDWAFNGFHTVTFFGSAGRPNVMRTDDGVTGYAAESSWADNIGPNGACGKGTAAPCEVSDVNEYVSSGVPIADPSDFRVTINLPEGSYHYHCTVHPSMDGIIEVVPVTTNLPSQIDLDAAVKNEVAADTAQADQLVAEYNTQPAHSDNGTWTVHVGLSTPNNHVALLKYLPSSLHVAPGDKVHYVVGNGEGGDQGTLDEIHTVTFPDQVVGFGTISSTPLPDGTAGASFIPACDPDGEAGPLPGIPYGIVCPVSLEVLIAPWITSQHRALNDQVLTPVTHDDSGLLVPVAAPPQFRDVAGTNHGTQWPNKFDASFPNSGTFKYACEIHGQSMSGEIVVG